MVLQVSIPRPRKAQTLQSLQVSCPVFINAVSPKSGAVTLSEHREVKEPATYIFGERRETKNPNRSASNHQPAPAPFFWRGQAEGHWPHRRWPLAAPQVAVGRPAGGSWPHRRCQVLADYFPFQAHNQSMNRDHSRRAFPGPLVPGPLVPVFSPYPPPPLPCGNRIFSTRHECN